MKGYEAITDFLKVNLTEKAFTYWVKVNEKIATPIWDRDTSSSGKYHRRKDGSMPTVAEHTLEMLKSAYAIRRCLGVDYEPKQSPQVDQLLLAIALHDCLKYGTTPGAHTKTNHDRIMSGFLHDNFPEEALESAIFWHQGRWSVGVNSAGFANKAMAKMPELKQIDFVLHILDMLSTENKLEEVRL